jgi:predicted O-methyltransferase YrrM
MNFITEIFKTIKSIFLMPVYISSISKNMKDLKQIENKIDLLTQRVNDLNMNSTFEKQERRLSCQELSESEKLPISTEISEVFENHFLQIEALLSIYNSLPNLKYMPATRGWAGSPDFLNKIVEIILKQKPRIVLEASSGVSTVLIGLALKMNNSGKALSFEHDTSYAEITRKNIEVNDIEDISIIMDCPLNDYLIDGEAWKWYDTKELTFTDKIDLLIIDGPPRATQNLARYPAIPLLHKYFSDNVIILLDDANRPDEIIIIEKWIEFLEKEGYKINIERYINFEKGMVLLKINRKI